ncbi:hypothetical protein ACMYSQ_008876 [Aspergillus niger]
MRGEVKFVKWYVHSEYAGPGARKAMAIEFDLVLRHLDDPIHRYIGRGVGLWSLGRLKNVTLCLSLELGSSYMEKSPTSPVIEPYPLASSGGAGDGPELCSPVCAGSQGTIIASSPHADSVRSGGQAEVVIKQTL